MNMQVSNQEQDQEVEKPLEPLPKLDHWYRNYESLSGNVFGHPNFPDGALITTSPLKWISTGARLAQTKNTLYALGAMRP